MSSTELDYARKLVASALVAPDHYYDVITAACALTHKIDDVDSAPRIVALGLKGSGKSTLLKVAYRLGANVGPPTGVLGMTAPSYIAEFRMNPHFTPNLDEVNHLFGEAGQNGKHSKFYTYLNQGHLRDTAYAQFQENKVPLRIPVFGVAFMAGLGLGCPEDTRDRAVVLRMEKAPKKAEVADFALPETKQAFSYGGRMLKSWAQRTPRLDVSACRSLHKELNHRTMDVWGPLFAVALAADDNMPGGEWVKRMLTAFERLELNAGVPVYAPEDQILLDYADYYAQHGPSDGVPSGAFSQFAYEQEHGAYLGMKPGQFRQFAVTVLGPTAAYYDRARRETVRGWTGVVHKMNMEHAAARLAELEADKEEASDGPVSWEDF